MLSAAVATCCCLTDWQGLGMCCQRHQTRRRPPEPCRQMRWLPGKRNCQNLHPLHVQTAFSFRTCRRLSCGGSGLRDMQTLLGLPPGGTTKGLLSKCCLGHVSGENTRSTCMYRGPSLLCLPCKGAHGEKDRASANGGCALLRGQCAPDIAGPSPSRPSRVDTCSRTSAFCTLRTSLE